MRGLHVRTRTSLPGSQSKNFISSSHLRGRGRGSRKLTSSIGWFHSLTLWAFWSRMRSVMIGQFQGELELGRFVGTVSVCMVTTEVRYWPVDQIDQGSHSPRPGVRFLSARGQIQDELEEVRRDWGSGMEWTENRRSGLFADSDTSRMWVKCFQNQIFDEWFEFYTCFQEDTDPHIPHSPSTNRILAMSSLTWLILVGRLLHSQWLCRGRDLALRGFWESRLQRAKRGMVVDLNIEFVLVTANGIESPILDFWKYFRKRYLYLQFFVLLLPLQGGIGFQFKWMYKGRQYSTRTGRS